MFKKALFALAAGSALVAIPATANAQYGGYYPQPRPSYGYGGGYGSYGGYNQPYYGGRYNTGY